MHPPPACPEAAPEASRFTRLAIVLAIVVAGAWLRFAHLANHALWVDEIITLERAVLPLGDILASLRLQGPINITADYCPPLYHLLLHLALNLGRTDAIAKLPGILCGLGTLFLVYRLTRDFFSTRNAVIVSILISCSSFMVYYSRDIRPFSLFVLLSLGALYVFWKAIHNGMFLSWTTYAVLSAGALYTLYVYPMNLVGLGAYLLVTGLSQRVLLGRPIPWKTWKAFLLASMGALGLYAPWLPAHRFVIKLADVQFPPGPSLGVPLPYIVGAYRDFILWEGNNSWYFIISLALLLLGCRRAWRMGRGRELLLLFLWGMTPIPVYYLLDSSHPFYSRHVITLYFFVIIGIGLGLDALVAWLAKNRQSLVPLLAGAALATIYSLPNVENLETFFQSATSMYKNQALKFYLNKNNCDYFDSCRPDSISFVSRWYLPWVFKPLANVEDQTYKRLLYVDTEPTLTVTPGYASSSSEKNITTFDHRIGLVNSSPIVLRPVDGLGYGYREDFHDFRLYLHARQWNNLELNRQEGYVGCSDPSRPGSLVYTFDISEFKDQDSAKIVLSFFYKEHVLSPTDDRCQIEMSLDNGPYESLVSIGIEDFQDILRQHRSQYAQYQLTKTISLPGRRLRGASTVSVRCTFAPGMTLSAIRLAGFAFGLEGRRAPGTPDPAERLLDNIHRNTRLVPWREAPTFSLDRPLTAFALSESAAGDRDWVGSPEELETFLQEHPAAKPVFELVDAAGRPRYALFDLFLDATFPQVDAPGQLPVRFAKPTIPVAGIEARGRLRSPEITLANTPLPLRLWLPKGTLVSLAAGNPITAFFQPDFRKSAFDPQQFFLAQRIRQNGDEPCLRCQDDGDCWFAYLFASATPLKELRLTYFPRLFQDPAGKNRIIVQYSEDFKTFRDVDVFQGNGSGSWTGHDRARTVRIPLNPSTRQMWIRFALTSEACQVWSSPESPTSVLATVSGEPFITIIPQAASTALTAAFDNPNDFTLRLSGDGDPFPISLLRD
jgi:hypothetical protein